MALKLRSADLYTIMQDGELTPSEVFQAYNALDSGVTLRVHEALAPKLAASEHASTSYRFVRAMQAPALAMMRTGVAIQAQVRQDETARYTTIRDKAQALLDRLADAVWGPETYVEVERVKEIYTPVGKRGQPLNPRTRVVKTEQVRTRPRGLNAGSDKQCLAFFNIALGYEVLHEIRKTAAGTIRTPSANNKALRKWAEKKVKGPGVPRNDRSIPYVRLAAPFVSLILTIRDADKMLAVLRTPLDPDGRMRCSYNVAGTENGRWSSSKNVHGRGTNLQNITPSMRRMFCADDGQWFISTDLEQAESRVVAGLVWAATGDDTYWNACLSGDLHTTVARMTWPELGWTDDSKENRKIADQPSRELEKYTYRDISKRLGHGSNYRGSPFGIAQAVGIPPRIVGDFQSRYFAAFPAIPSWHDWIKTQLNNVQHLDTPVGRRRWFFGRPSEDSTLREAIAYVPQSTVGELLNLIMYRVWARSLKDPSLRSRALALTNAPLTATLPSYLPITLLLQNHDAFALQTPISTHLPWLISEIDAEFNNAKIPLRRGNEVRHLTIPGEFVCGWNWAYEGPDNPDGLRKWRGFDDRVRQQGARPSLGDWLSRPLG